MTRSPAFSLLLALFLVPLPAGAQCDYRTTYSGAFRLTAFDVALDGQHLWVATSYGIALYDRGSDPAVPVGSLALPGPTTEVEVVGAHGYVASGSTLFTVRRSGHSLEVLNALALGAVANDLIAVGQHLYVASSTGIIQIDVLVPDRPAVSARLSTTAGPAFSVAAAGHVLYAADGDGSIDLYTIQIPALPQMLGTLTTGRRPTSVRAGGGLIFASDDLQTDIFSAGGTSSVRLGGGNFGAASMALHSSSVIYAAGTDRRLRAIDVSSPETPTILFEQELPASEGSVNRILDLLSADGRLYVAAGDLGLLTVDARAFTAPFPVRASRLGPMRSALVVGARIFAAPQAGSLQEYERTGSGALSFVRQWDEERTSVIHDGSATRLLTSSGAVLRVWDISGSPSAVVTTASLRAGVRSAVLAGSTALAVLVDSSLWRIDGSAAPAQVPLGDARPSFIARGGAALALADLNENGTTTIRWLAGGDLSATPAVATFEGAATSGIAIASPGLVAGVTFRGLLAADFSTVSPSVITFPRPAGPARQLHAEGSDLFVLTSEAIEIWDASARQLRRTFSIPGEAVSMHAGEYAVVATGEGLVVVDHKVQAAQPSLLPFASGNLYYSRMTSSSGAVHLLRDGMVRTLRVDGSGRPVGDVSNPVARPARDFAVIGNRTYTVSEGGKVSGPGVELQIEEGADAAALSLHAVGDTLYLSISRGCLSGGCEKKTLIITTSGGALALAGSMPGALLDAEVHGERAYALFDDPDEIRILDVRMASQPAVIRSAAAEGNAVSIGYSAATGTIYTIGQKIYAYSESSLSKSGELLDAYVADPTGRVSYLDQTIAIDGSCAVVAGREFSPRVYRIIGPAQWQEVAAPAVPAAVRAVATVNGAHYLLSDYALEIWSATPHAGRMRPVR